MQVRGVVLVTAALFLGIVALILHLLALCSPHWKIIKRDAQPSMAPVSYGLWKRCEYRNETIMKQGVSLGVRNNVEMCYPNRYMRYPVDKFDTCYGIRRLCPTLQKSQIHEGCRCRYVPSDKALQWLTVLAAICLILGLLLLYLKTVSSPQNASAVFVLGYGPFICFALTLLLMVSGLIVLGSFLRRDTYEDYSFPLKSVSADNRQLQSFELYSLRIYAKSRNLSADVYNKAVAELRDDANTHFHTVIGRATISEIVATVLIFVVTGVTFWLGDASRSEDM